MKPLLSAMKLPPSAVKQLSTRYTLNLAIFRSRLEIPFTALQGYCFPVVVCGLAVFLFFPDPDEADRGSLFPVAHASAQSDAEPDSRAGGLPEGTDVAPRERRASASSVAGQVGEAILGGPDSASVRLQT